jgi:choline dehydrogenase
MRLVYDDIVIGAGSSGAVVAARLSEDGDRSVLLLEAGPDYVAPEFTPADLLDPTDISVSSHDWGFDASAVPNRSIPFPRGRVTGGSSAVNGTVALRGTPGNYEEWTELGNEGWSWRDVLPFFRKLEDDPEEAGDLHGAGGPIPIRRWKPEELVPVEQAFFAYCRRAGFNEVHDHNDPDATGVGPIPVNQRGGIRVSTAIGYLLPARHRLNLTIRSNCHVHRILFDGIRATGVELDCDGVVQRVLTRRITLSAGAIASPAILMRSGIGPAVDLRALGIDVVVDSPGVGANLLDHPNAGAIVIPKGGAPDTHIPFIQMMVRYTASGSSDFNDMQFNFLTHSDLSLRQPQIAEQIGASIVMSLTASLQRPKSRGRMSLASKDPHEAPRIELDYCTDPEDMRRMIEGVRMCWEASQSPELEPFVERVAPLDEETVRSDDALAEYIRNTARTTFHPVGTARMGPDGDRNAVVDAHGRVRGVDGLRVVDASIMPNIVNCNTNLTSIMIGERVVAWMQTEAT